MLTSLKKYVVAIKLSKLRMNGVVRRLFKLKPKPTNPVGEPQLGQQQTQLVDRPILLQQEPPATLPGQGTRLATEPETQLGSERSDNIIPKTQTKTKTKASNMNYIFYHANSSLTGRELKRALRIEGGTEGPGQRPNKFIRWGNRAQVRFNAAGSVLNRRESMDNAANKGRALELLTQNGINVPPAVTTFNGELVVGRTENHVRGSGLFLISSQRDFELAQRNLGCTHFMLYIPTEREYRVHVVRGEVIGVGEKRMADDATSLHIRNVDTGWTFRYIDNAPQNIKDIGLGAVQALGLDIGAVDVIKSTGNNLYVLEVNTAPSLVKEPETRGAQPELGPMFEAYKDALAVWLRDE
jgi:hypothetical protein